MRLGIGLNLSVRMRHFCCFLAVICSADGLRITDVTFPDYAMLGQTITMVCDYKLDEGEFVDSIKWYRDGREFYRILTFPRREDDKIRVFTQPGDGINLDLEKSGVSFAK